MESVRNFGAKLVFLNLVGDGYGIQIEAESSVITKFQHVNVQTPITFESLSKVIQRGDIICE